MTGELSWRRLAVLLRNLPRDSQLSRARNGDAAVDWDLTVEQLSQIKYAVQTANWQRAEGKGSRPKPDRRPWQSDGKKLGGTKRPQVEVRALLDSYSARG